MRRSWTVGLCAPLMSAAVLTGCNTEQNRTSIDNATDQPRQKEQLTLSGCLSTGTGTDQYMLTSVELAPRAEQPSDTPSRTGAPITPDSQVRLASNDRDQLEELIGQKVTVTGLISDDGRNTIGTSGGGQAPASGQPESRDDRSQAASPQHHSDKVAQEAGPMGQRSMNNGTFPEMTVMKINGSGEKCSGWSGQERR